MYRWFKIIALCVLLALTGCIQPNVSSPAAVSLPSTSFSGIVNQIMPSVVYILSESVNESGQVSFDSGSGVIVRPDGYILTNQHVVQGARRVRVVLHDWTTYDVTGIWGDDILDLAVIKIDANNLPAAPFGDPDTINVGDWVIALGHALGMSPEEGGATVTAGIVSNLDRSFSLEQTSYYDLIQTDAPINPGNSGGPLINTSGQVIGINSVGIPDAQNINFAINVGTARHVFEDLVLYGKAHHPFLGVGATDVTMRALRTGNAALQPLGAVISYAEANGPAGRAGVRQNDVIVQLGKEPVQSAASLIKALWRYEVGDVVEVVFWRAGEELKSNVTLGERTPGSPLL